MHDGVRLGVTTDGDCDDRGFDAFEGHHFGNSPQFAVSGNSFTFPLIYTDLGEDWGYEFDRTASSEG